MGSPVTLPGLKNYQRDYVKMNQIPKDSTRHTVAEKRYANYRNKGKSKMNEKRERKKKMLYEKRSREASIRE